MALCNFKEFVGDEEHFTVKPKKVLIAIFKYLYRLFTWLIEMTSFPPVTLACYEDLMGWMVHQE